jgi:hypothetical protein
MLYADETCENDHEKESVERRMGRTQFTGLIDYSLSIPPLEGAGGAKNLKAPDNKKGSL